VSERSEGGRLTSVSFLARLPEQDLRWCIVTARSRLDIFGDGRWYVPEDGGWKEAEYDPRGALRARRPEPINMREYDRMDYVHRQRLEAG
jgi:hypothetical protein